MDVTVIVPCFNSEETIEKCITSLLNQEMKVMVLVINDGSSDRTEQIAKQYEKQYDNVRVISQENRGLPQARKTGVEFVRTKYTAFVDSDDWIEPEMIKILYSLSERYGAEISACEVINEIDDKTHFSGSQTGKVYNYYGEEALFMLHSRKRIYPYLCNKLFITEVAKKLPFPEGNFIGEDYITLYSTIEKSRCVVIDKPLYHYVQKIGTMSKRGYGTGHRQAYEHYLFAYNNYCLTHTAIQCQSMANYLCVEFSALIVAMARNHVVDKEVVVFVQYFLRKNIGAFFKTDASVKFKISSLIIAFNPKLFLSLYQGLDKLKYKRENNNSVR